MKKEIVINDDWREILEIDKVDVFFKNYCNHSQYVSLSTKHCGKLGDDQLKTIKLELEEDLKHQILLYKENKDGFADRLRRNLLLDSEKDVNNYFKEIRKNNKQIVREIKKTN